DGDHYGVSIQCGERALLPAVREASSESLIIADGFSCREQIAQTTPRRALHLVQVIQMALRGQGSATGVISPESMCLPDQTEEALAKAREAVKLGLGAFL